MADYSEEQIVALRTAIASGVLTVRHGETSSTYRSLDEMERILARLEADLSETPRRRMMYAYQSGKGL